MEEFMTEEVLKGIQGALELATKGGTNLMDEAIRLFIMLSILDILKFASVFVIFYIVKRFIDGMLAAEETEKAKKIWKATKTSLLVASITFFTVHSYVGLVNLTKLLVAPKIFLLEKGYQVYQQVTNK